MMQLSAGVELAGGETTIPPGHMEHESVYVVDCAADTQKKKFPVVWL
jgi:hypothetical protein